MNILKRLSAGIIPIVCLSLLIGCSNSQGVNKLEMKQLNEAFLQGDFERIYNQLSEEFRKEISLTDLQSAGAEFNKGVTEYVFQTSLPIVTNLTQYIWHDQSRTKNLTALADDAGTIVGLIFEPITTYPETDRTYTKNTYQMPIQDEWLTGWGGASEPLNYHYPHESQRYAYDLVISHDNLTYQGDKEANESYYAYGKAVVAPADGTVVGVEVNIQDNHPVGTMNAKNPFGNYVIIDHGNEEYSVIGHMQYQSASVKVGDQVKQGDVIGLCGNSGNSSEAHIHFQVQNSPDIASGNAKSIRIRLNNDVEPIRGQFIKP
ncbi:M23 family metallopeptidase [Paenibacillus albiflavus]|nr:M23 family metallopeptidase [Paenibacillus albiflavus]